MEEIEPSHSQEAEEEPSSRSYWSPLDTFAITAITVAAAVLRLVRLDDPKKLMFDEVYYAKDACWYVNSSPGLCGINAESTLVHPPLAKWLIAIGVRIFGYDSFGWRISAAVAGTITIALVYLLARRLLRSTLGASVTAGLLAIDLLHFVESRIAMLDIFVPMFGIAALLFLTYDRDATADAASDPEGAIPRGLLQRPWRIAAGLAAGFAVASKWSGGFFLILLIVLAVAWDLPAWSRRGQANSFVRSFVAALRGIVDVIRRQGISIVVAFVLVPLLAYSFTYIGRLHEPISRYDGSGEDCPWEEGRLVYNFVNHQVCMLNFHRTLTSTHSYQSPAWSWIALKRPVSYYFETDPNGDYKEVFASGSPFVWWTSVLALLVAAWRWLRRREPGGPEGFIVAGFVFTYGPWLISGLLSPRSAVFLFYLLPTVPFMCLALGYVASRLGRSWEATAAVALFSAAAIWFFVFYYPLLTKIPLPRTTWEKRIWVFDDCDKPSADPTTSLVTETKPRRTIVRTTFTTGTDEDVPPDGWCWI